MFETFRSWIKSIKKLDFYKLLDKLFDNSSTNSRIRKILSFSTVTTKSEDRDNDAYIFLTFISNIKFDDNGNGKSTLYPPSMRQPSAYVIFNDFINQLKVYIKQVGIMHCVNPRIIDYRQNFIKKSSNLIANAKILVLNTLKATQLDKNEIKGYKSLDSLKEEKIIEEDSLEIENIIAGKDTNFTEVYDREEIVSHDRNKLDTIPVKGGFDRYHDRNVHEFKDTINDISMKRITWPLLIYFNESYSDNFINLAFSIIEIYINVNPEEDIHEEPVEPV
jgi:hypothetical protein